MSSKQKEKTDTAAEDLSKQLKAAQEAMHSRLDRLSHTVSVMRVPFEEEAVELRQETQGVMYELKRQQQLQRDLLTEYTMLVSDVFSLHNEARAELNRVKGEQEKLSQV